MSLLTALEWRLWWIKPVFTHTNLLPKSTVLLQKITSVRPRQTLVCSMPELPSKL